MDTIKISNTSTHDLKRVLYLFDEAIKINGRNGYKVWDSIDKEALEKDINNKLQFKLETDIDILCVFSIQYSDPYIWRDRDKNDAIYLHRIVVDPIFKGQKLFKKVLVWAMEFAKLNRRKYIRMDTWADNYRLIEYYKSFGFRLVENYKTSDIEELPIQNRNLNVSLLELTVD